MLGGKYLVVLCFLWIVTGDIIELESNKEYIEISTKEDQKYHIPILPNRFLRISLKLINAIEQEYIQLHVQSDSGRYIGEVMASYTNPSITRVFCEVEWGSDTGVLMTAITHENTTYGIETDLLDRQLVENEAENATVASSTSQFWSFDVEDSIKINNVPLYFTVKDISNPPAEHSALSLTATFNQCPQTEDELKNWMIHYGDEWNDGDHGTGDGDLAFLTFDKQARLIIARYGPELRQGRWYVKIATEGPPRNISIVASYGMPYVQYWYWEIGTPVVFAAVLTAIFLGAFNWMKFCQPKLENNVKKQRKTTTQLSDALNSNTNLSPYFHGTSTLHETETHETQTQEANGQIAVNENGGIELGEIQHRNSVESENSIHAENSDSVSSQSTEINSINDNDSDDSSLLVVCSDFYEKSMFSYLNYRTRAYIHYTVLCGLFFGIPALQVVLQVVEMLNSGDRNLCYYNEFCMRPNAWGLTSLPALSAPFQILAWNNVFSNIGYFCTGFAMICYLLAIQIYRRNHREATKLIPMDMSLIWAMAIALIFVGINSSIYHLCPTRTMFQIDTVYMFVLAGLSSVEIFRRQYGFAWSPYYTFLFFGVLMLANYIGTLADSAQSPYFSMIWVGTIMVISSMAILGIFIYIVYRFKKGKKDSWTYLWIVIFCMFTAAWIFAILQITNILGKEIPNSQLLLYTVVVCFVVVPLTAHLVNKCIIWTKTRNQMAKRVWIGQTIILTLSLIFMAVGMVFFTIFSPTNKEFTPEKSRDDNSECVMGNFYDAHDWWHIFSSLGLMLFILSFLHGDFNELDRHKRRTSRNLSEISG